MSVNLNTSDPEAVLAEKPDKQITEQISKRIAEQVAEAGGWIAFDRFMSAALYEPKLGYYESASVFGREGDFVTGAQLGPWLALGYADLIAWGWQEMGSPSDWMLVEQGGGSGALLVDVLALLAKKSITPPQVIAVETSLQMRNRQQAGYAAHHLEVTSVATLEEVGELENCLMFCNELPDAFPVRCYRWQGGEMFERGVAHREGRFVWQDAPMVTQATEHEGLEIDDMLKKAWPDGYLSEWNPSLAAWQASVAKMIKRGFLFCVDYGYSQQEYYRPQRIEGTLMGHREHQVVADVLDKPGSCDITAHIDFTALRRIGEKQGFMSACFMNQGAWLAQCPAVQRYVESLAADGSVESVQQLAHAKRMLMPFGMGETFKLFIQAIHVPAVAPSYLKQFNRLNDLRLTQGAA